MIKRIDNSPSRESSRRAEAAEERKGNLVIVTAWYPPEPAPFGRMMQELAEDLSGSGWNVTVITGFPNHPGGVVHEGFRKRWLSAENHGNVRVLRVWLATSPNRSTLNRLATFLSFTLISAWRLLRCRHADVIFAVLQPLSVGVTLPLIARVKRAALVLNVQDLHPDAQIRLGMVRHPALIRILRAVESFAYRKSTALTVICDHFKRHVIARGADPARVFVIDNWIDTERIRPDPEKGLEFRSEIGFAAQDFVVLCAGTLGHVSGAHILVEAAQLLQDEPSIKFLIVGEGPLLPSLKQRAASAGLKNIVFRPFQPESRLTALQSSADVSVVTLAPDFAEVSVPSKVLAYLAAGRPVLASVPAASETAMLLRRAEAGVVVTPGRADELATMITRLAADRKTCVQMAGAARAYAVTHLSRLAAVARYESVFQQACRKK